MDLRFSARVAANEGKSRVNEIDPYSGYGHEDDIGLAREDGFDGHLVQPCDMDALETMMTTTGLCM